MRSLVAAAILFSLLCGGCHLIFPFDAAVADAKLRDLHPELQGSVDGALADHHLGDARDGDGDGRFWPSNLRRADYDGLTASPCGAVTVTGATPLNTASCLLLNCQGKVVEQEIADGAPVMACVLAIDKLDVADGASMRVTGPHPLIVLATTATIDGTIDVSAEGTTPGPGGHPGGDPGTSDPYGASAPGPGGGKACLCALSNEDDCGGGGGGFGSPGAAGGEEGSGCGSPSAGGAAAGSPSLTPLTGGYGGASGSNENYGPPGAGGAGGGALQISASRITIAGAIHAGGGGGVASPTQNNDQAGGGGGSGGAILLEATTLDVSGWLACNGGGGGAGIKPGTTCTSGSDGLVGDQPAAGGSGANCAPGGAGAAGAKLPDGGQPTANTGAGGGGGGLGRIRLNTPPGSPMPANRSGVTSQGPLRPL